MSGLVRRTRHPERLAEYEAELFVPPMPKSLVHVWIAFRRIRKRKGSNGFAASPIEWPDIDAFVRNSRTHLTPWEIELIEDLDDLFLMDHTKDQLQ